MRRLFAALLVLTLLWGMGAAAMAEEGVESLQWSDYQAENSCITGAFHFLADTGLMLWIPNRLEAFEDLGPQEEESGGERIALYTTNDRVTSIQVFKVEAGEGASFAALRDDLVEFGMSSVRLITVNGLNGLTFQDVDHQLTYLMLEDAKGGLLEFMFYPIAPEAPDLDFRTIAASIQPENVDAIVQCWKDYIGMDSVGQ